MKNMKIYENQNKFGGILKICIKTAIALTEMHFFKKEIAADIFQNPWKSKKIHEILWEINGNQPKLQLHKEMVLF